MYRLGLMYYMSVPQQAAPTGQDGSEDCEAAESSKDESDNNDSTRTENETERKGDEEQNDMPLSLKWPNTLFKQVTYLFLLPVILPLWLTLPDVRNQAKTQTLF